MSQISEIINEIQDYMITDTLFNKYSLKSLSKKTQSKTEAKTQAKTEAKTQAKTKIITLKETDQLFWYFFIAKYGYDAYTYIDSSKFVKEKQIKIQNIEISKKNNSLLKQNKIKIIDYESDLLNSNKISTTTLKGLAAYNELNIYYVKNKHYYYFNFNDVTTPIIIYNYGKYSSCDIEPSQEIIENIKSKYYHIENPDKPLKGVSTYKVNELHEICKKLNITIKLETGKSKSKKQLYDEIIFNL